MSETLLSESVSESGKCAIFEPVFEPGLGGIYDYSLSPRTKPALSSWQSYLLTICPLGGSSSRARGHLRKAISRAHEHRVFAFASFVVFPLFQLSKRSQYVQF